MNIGDILVCIKQYDKVIIDPSPNKSGTLNWSFNEWKKYKITNLERVDGSIKQVYVGADVNHNHFTDIPFFVGVNSKHYRRFDEYFKTIEDYRNDKINNLI